MIDKSNHRDVPSGSGRAGSWRGLRAHSLLSSTELIVTQRGPGGASAYPYATHLDIRFPPLETIDVNALVAAVRDQWYNQTLCKVNDSIVRLGVMQGEYRWHKHDDDEFFFVLDGRFLIDLEPTADGTTPGRVIELRPREGFVVPKGVVHRTRAPERSIILMVETATVVPTGD
jgi:mannose-6-phosphate isomerase-like protein (cupin superfamily)